MATVAYFKRKVGDAITASVSENGKSQSEKITEETCKLLADKIPDITTKIANGILADLKTKIDSEAFSTDFVNVLQRKLLEENKTSEPFLSKFSSLFDKIIKKAEENKENEKQQGGAEAVEPVAEAATAVEPGAEAATVVEPVAEAVEPVAEAATALDTGADANPNQLGGNAKRTTRRGNHKVKMQTRKHKRRTNKRRNKKGNII